MSVSWTPARCHGFATDCVTVKTLHGYGNRIERERHQRDHRSPSARRALRAGQDDRRFISGPRLRMLSVRRKGVHCTGGSVLPFRNPTAYEAWIAVDEWLRYSYSIRLTDVTITDSKGVWIAKQPCRDRNRGWCGSPLCTGSMLHTYRLWEGHQSSLSISGEYEGGGYHRDRCGRMLSPSRSWAALFQEALRCGDPIARFNHLTHQYDIGRTSDLPPV